jgi:hypothetical protein
MRITWSLCLLILVAGCGKSDSTSQNRPPIQPLQGGNLYPPLHASSPAYLEYQGRTAIEWGQSLNDRDPYVAQEASQALASMGEPGFRQLVNGLGSSNWETRLLCLKGFTREAALENGHYAVGPVAQLLQDPHPAVRQAALVRLGWFRAEAAPAAGRIRAIANGDDDPENRRIAAEIIVSLNESVSGYVALLGDPNPQVRSQAASRLGMMREAASSALPALRRLADSDPDVKVRGIAANSAMLIQEASRN